MMIEQPEEVPPGRSFLFVKLVYITVFLILFASPSHSFDLKSRVKEFTLDNGLKTIVLERKGAPTFAAHIAFKVGSVEESRGLTGAAHMLEHMLFKGTKAIGTKDWAQEKPFLEKVYELGEKLDRAKRNNVDDKTLEELTTQFKQAQAEHKKYVISESYSQLYSSEGGVGFNAGTSKDMTTYIIRLPSNKLELWAWIESDRLANPVFREYYSERDVVWEERRRSYENNPQGKLYERYLAGAFIAHPYGQPIIGWQSDIAGLPYRHVEKFYNTWYVPNNAVIAIVGDVNFEEVKSVVTKYFSGLNRKPLPPRIVSEEPAQGGERRVNLVYDASPTFMMGFHKPTLPHEDDYVFDVIDSILSDGRSSRLNREIVMNKKVAVSVGTFSVPGSRYGNLFTISGKPREGYTTQEVEEAVWDELERLKREPADKKELEKVINNLEAEMIRGLVSDYSMARRLTYFQQVAGDWRYMTDSIEKIKAVTAEDIQRVAKKYFAKENMTVATLVQKAKDEK